MPAKNYDDIFEDMNSNKRRRNNRYDGNINTYNSTQVIGRQFYTIKDDQYLIIFNANKTDDMIRMRYEKLPTTLTLTTDTATITNDIFAKGTIPYLAIGELLYNRGEEQRGGELISFGIGQIREMYTFYNNSGYENPSGKQIRSAKGSRFNI